MVDPVPELKRQVGDEIARRIAGRNQWHVAVDIGTDQPRVSDLRRGRLERFSLETLIRFLSRLRCRPKLLFEDVPLSFRKSR
jgi:predicted XRE-type DNA-binding protein